jgi:hypothetical protein
MAARQFGEGLLLLGADGDVRHVRGGFRRDAASLGSLDPVVTSAESGSGGQDGQRAAIATVPPHPNQAVAEQLAHVVGIEFLFVRIGEVGSDGRERGARVGRSVARQSACPATATAATPRSLRGCHPRTSPDRAAPSRCCPRPPAR